MAVINEVKYGVRRTFIILLSIWIGNKKPPRDVFMDGPIASLKKIEKDGFLVKGKQYKLKVLVITVDTIARSGMGNTTQCNGMCGCDFCLHPGEQVPKGRGSVRVYPQPDPELDEANDREHITYPLRTLEQHLRDVDLAVSSGTRVNGIIGPNPFMKLPEFDFVKALVPEYLHSCCHGSFKLYVDLLTSKVGGNGKKEWFVGGKMAVINARLKLTRPPYEITRTIECLDNLTDWKASTYRTFTLYFFPILEDILPSKYFIHYSSLSYGVYLLLQNRVSRENVLKANSSGSFTSGFSPSSPVSTFLFFFPALPSELILLLFFGFPSSLLFASSFSTMSLVPSLHQFLTSALALAMFAGSPYQ